MSYSIEGKIFRRGYLYHFYNGRSKEMKSLHSNLCYQFIYRKLSVAFSRNEHRTVHKIPYANLPC